MNIFRLDRCFLVLLLSLLMLSCSGSDDDAAAGQQPAPQPVQAQYAYFPEGLPDHYDLSVDAVDFRIPVFRSTSELPYLWLPIKAFQQGRGNQFSLRDVLFDDYSDRTQVVVNYNPSYLVSDVIDTLTLSIADSAYIHKDYRSSYTFTVGYHKPDYTLNCTYTGRFVDKEDNEYLRFIFQLGVDVTLVKYAVFLANRDSSAIADAMISGEIPSHELTAGGPVEVLMEEEAGEYALIALAYKGTELVAACRHQFTYKRSQELAEQWVQVGFGVYTYNAKPLDDYEGTGSVFSGTRSSKLYQGVRNRHRFKILPWGAPDCEGLIFTVKDDNTLTVDGIYTGKDYIDESGENQGHIYFSDLQTLFPDKKYEGEVSCYIDSTRTYYIRGGYWFGEEWFGPVLETFTVTRHISNAPATSLRSSPMVTTAKVPVPRRKE